MSKTLAILPRLNEKTYTLSASRVFVFTVPMSANKHAVARAVEAQFDVKVVNVNMLNVRGKSKRVMSITGKRMQNAESSRSNFKKAYVTLAEGHSLPFFDAVEESEKKELEVQEKIQKASEKAEKAAEKSADEKPRLGLHLPKKRTAEKKEDEK